MARADFYILSQGTDPARFACGLANKAWQQGHTLHILASSREAATGLDELLWTFHDISFLPHALVGNRDSDRVPITIGWPEAAQRGGDVLINLSSQWPAQAAAFNRVAEIVGADSAARQQARERYRQYREKGFDLHSHNMSDGQADA